MPHSPDLIDSILKEAGFFDDMKSKLTGFLQSREKKRAVSRVGAHFDAKNKDWDRVVSNSSRKSFVKELAGDARADDKLKMHVDSMNRLKTGKVLSTVSGTGGSRTARRDGSQSYKIVKLRGSNRLGCTCRDWRFKKSVAAQGEQADCKHIREFKQMNKTAAHPSYDAQMQALSPAEQRKLRAQEVRNEKKYGRKDFWKDPRYRADVSMRFPPMFSSKRSWRELTDADYRKIVAQYKKCRTDRDRYMALRMELQRIGIPKRVWREKVRAPGGTWKTAAYEEGGSFTHDGQKYSLREAFRTARAKPTKQVDVDKLKWVLQYDRPNPKRLASANLNAPIIVAPDRRGRPTVVDGLHRLSKAVQQGKKTLPAKMLTLRELKKEAGHVEDRIAERAPGSTYEVAKIEAQIPSMKLRKGQTYHVPLKRGKGYAVIGDIGPKHVVKTVLGPNMRPPGHRAKAAMADVSSRSMQKGDVVVMTMGPKTYIGKSDSSLAQRAKERIFRKTSPAMQGGYTHSGIYVGKGQIVEARRDGVRKRSLRSALKNIDGAVVVRPKAGKKAREGAAEFAKSRVGAAYESEAFLTRQGVSLLAPKRMEKLLKRKSDIESTKKFTCGNLVSAAYVSQGFTPRKDKGEWSLTVPADFLNADKADRVKSMGSYADAKAQFGRLAGQKLARAPRDYKQEYAEYHGKPDQVSNRSLRNQARRKMGLKKGDPREVDHKTPISKGGGNGKGNLSAVSREFNRRKFNGS